MKPLYLIAAMALVIASCSPSSKLRRAKRLIAQAEASGLSWKSDTVFTTVTLEVPIVKIDTVVTVHNWRDTITVTRDRVTTRVVVNPIEKRVYISSKCDSAVVIKKVPFQVYRDIKVGYSKVGLAWRMILALVVGFAGGYFVEKIRK